MPREQPAATVRIEEAAVGCDQHSLPAAGGAPIMVLETLGPASGARSALAGPRTYGRRTREELGRSHLPARVLVRQLPETGGRASRIRVSGASWAMPRRLTTGSLTTPGLTSPSIDPAPINAPNFRNSSMSLEILDGRPEEDRGALASGTHHLRLQAAGGGMAGRHCTSRRRVRPLYPRSALGGRVDRSVAVRARLPRGDLYTMYRREPSARPTISDVHTSRACLLPGATRSLGRVREAARSKAGGTTRTSVHD